jgi:hypothetical protein
MKKTIVNLGKRLRKSEQKEITGGSKGISDGQCTTSNAQCTYQGFFGNDCPDLDELCDLETFRCYCPD